ncbi:lipopolysaccharide transport periplasmic protein LptA [Hydrogenovibrio kuenenii]|uniref:lipopolysaccharide transport periplasmic protein LptA n=1 Tax=Hydrogenovibrio kuenenii TaxID=63658 RepID=UPI0004660F7E|nr:lipopolysaccharide transport periplasmic protein LptA [Hydrogenovibrio kuenenii]
MLKRCINLNSHINSLRKLSIVFLGAVTPTLCSTTWAATPSPDETQPVEITADTLNAKDKEGISIYQGNVIVIQGSTTIKGDKVTLHHPKRKISTAIVLGKPATFKRYLSEEKGWVTGHANKITYSTTNKTLLLEGNAKVVQEDKNTITGPRILYDLTHKTLSAKGKAKQRIKMIFTPPEEQEKK